MALAPSSLCVYTTPAPAGRSVQDIVHCSYHHWWFGYAHYVRPGELADHALTAKLGPNAPDLTAEDLRTMLKGRRGRIKTFLLDQSNLASIGNAYVHDILFLARLHPLRTVDTLTEAEIGALA